MSLLPVYTYGQPVLRKKAKPVRAITEEIVRLAGEMIETMRGANGIGLAANQVGSLHRIIVVDLAAVEENEKLEPLVMVNPEVSNSSEIWVMEEGCLSIPDVREEVERPDKITVHFRDLLFNDRVIETDGLLGRVILHEIDHLNGVLFIDRMPEEKRKLLRGRLNKIEKGYVDVAYPVVTSGKPHLPVVS